jgi:hypothetical protein
MIRILVQHSNRKPTRHQRFAVKCMLRKHLVMHRNSQINTSEPLREIYSRGTNNGMREHYLSLNFS